MRIIPNSFYGTTEFSAITTKVEKTGILISLENYIKVGGEIPTFSNNVSVNRRRRLQIILADGTKTRLQYIENNRVYYKRFGYGNKMLSSNIKLIKVEM